MASWYISVYSICKWFAALKMTFWQWLSWITPFQFSSQKSLCLLCATICNNGTFYIFTMHSVESQLVWLNTNLPNVILLFFKGTVWHNRPRTPKLWAVCPCHVSYTSEGYGCRSTTSLAARDGSTLHEEWKCCQPRWGRGKSKIQFFIDYTC